MSDQQSNSQGVELSPEQRLQNEIDAYGKLMIQKAYDRRFFGQNRFDEFWRDVKEGIKFELTEQNEVKANGVHPDWVVQGFREKNTELRNKYFLRPNTEETPQSEPAESSQPKSSPASKGAVESTPDVLFVSQQQLRDRFFMRKCGIGITHAIRDGLVKVDDNKAVRDASEIVKFLAPKLEPVPTPAAAKPAPKTTQISQNDLLNRRVLRQLEAEWSDQGGYLKAVEQGLIKVV